MKGRRFLCLILVMLLCCGCSEFGSVSGSDQGRQTETSACTHPKASLGEPEYVYGQYCDDPVEIYQICNACGEKILSGTTDNVIECYVASGREIVVKQPTCTEAGRAQGNCAKCGRLKEWEIPVTEHEYLWFYGDDTPSCRGCGLKAAVCTHAYEKTNDVSYTDMQAGVRSYTCKLCKDSYSVFYDQYGDYDVQTVFDTVCREAQKYGWTVILDYNLTSGTELDKENKSFTYREASSQNGTKLLTDAGLELLDVLNQNFSSSDHDRSDYYLTVTVDISRRADLGTSYFNVYLYVRGAE